MLRLAEYMSGVACWRGETQRRDGYCRQSSLNGWSLQPFNEGETRGYQFAGDAVQTEPLLEVTLKGIAHPNAGVQHHRLQSLSRQRNARFTMGA